MNEPFSTLTQINSESPLSCIEDPFRERFGGLV